ncbi:MurR/RpiR family transcriptional regulator [Alkalicoccobacillus murimartini]|uniref:DNA-binding MurR/RpiR family transcriptional regulator n=1 Tax=Alkalicoccobacillus murimartini TaxID=171685 RepID=A0ABT9YBX7_9BACI|nr:MurR/RpiR family transcriptional regulator [Alkalicoccobacillus murimartini]MDQ0205343.1 DNA-binding MurR/RpiR family transcriptional regulator [Alkalicoccobacillus murimartini]
MYNFFAKLQNFIEASTDQTNSEVVIATYILKHVRRIPELSIYELAEACHTSPATVTRFCRKFDNVTYKELKEFAREFNDFNTTEVTQDQSLSVDFYFQELHQALHETEKMMNSNNIKQVVNTLHQAKKIAFFGVTFSHVLARNAQIKFMRLGKYTSAYGNHENQLNDAESLDCEDVAVVISFSGETRFITRLIKVLKEQENKIIAITGTTDGYLASQADYVIPVSERKISQYKSPIIEEIMMQSAINVMYMGYSKLLEQKEGM